MSINEFQSKVRRDNGALFQALRKLKNTENPSKLFALGSEMEAWDVWPSLEVQAPACS